MITKEANMQKMKKRKDKKPSLIKNGRSSGAGSDPQAMLSRLKGSPRECMIETTDTDIFLVLDGVRIAKGGEPGTPEEESRIYLEPGIEVYEGEGFSAIVIDVEPGAGTKLSKCRGTLGRDYQKCRSKIPASNKSRKKFGQ
jgi:hypothetical protein